jgi:ABC-type branched-subunit amino acid transport system substrate-binding protein
MRGVLRGCFGAAVGLAVMALQAWPNELDVGRRIFRYGGNAAGEVSATFPGTTVALPPSVCRCAGCHGVEGAGGREGGINVPPVDWATLANPRTNILGRHERPGYDQTNFAQALADGVDPAGRPLGAGMPRYRLTKAQVAALLAYLQDLGTSSDEDPGIASDEIRLGTVLPLSGLHASAGEAVRRVLEREMAAAGLIYGRRLHLVAIDAGEDTAGAFRQLVENDDVFALIATLIPTDSTPGDRAVVIAPLAPSPTRRSGSSFYLLPTLGDQMRVLVDAVTAEIPRPARFAVIGLAGEDADAVIDQIARNGAVIVRRVESGDLGSVIPSDFAPPPDAVMALPSEDFGGLAKQLEDRPGRFLLAGLAASLLPEQMRNARLRMVVPYLSDDAADEAATTSPLAEAAVVVLVEALKRMGARASREGIVAALETFNSFHAAVLPPLSFRRGQHVGTRSSLVFRAGDGGRFVVLGPWREPR